MKQLDPQNILFETLRKQNPSWWVKMVEENDVYIEIRKDNEIDIYYNGGNIIKDLSYKNGKFNGQINYKYLLKGKSEYIDYDFSCQKAMIKNRNINLTDVNDFDEDSLKRIKANISQYYPASSEKGIQARFRTKTNCFVDSEFAYNSNDDKSRIDLVWIDTNNTKIVFVELKTMGNPQLYNKDLTIQLGKYEGFAKKYKNQIVDYYKRLFEIKKELNILPQGLTEIASLKGYTLETKPLLLFGDCEQKWINNNAKEINERIEDVAVGVYYFGKPSYECNIISKTKRNRYIFQP